MFECTHITQTACWGSFPQSPIMPLTGQLRSLLELSKAGALHGLGADD